MTEFPEKLLNITGHKRPYEIVKKKGSTTSVYADAFARGERMGCSSVESIVNASLREGYTCGVYVLSEQTYKKLFVVVPAMAGTVNWSALKDTLDGLDLDSYD